jgi:hypothetical protein
LLHDWITTVTGYDDQHVIRANQNGPRPTEPYATYQIISVNPADFAYWTKVALGVDDDIETTYRTPAMVMVSVDMYASDGITKLAELGQSKYLYNIRNIFTPSDIVLRNKRDTRDLTDLGDTRWRPRYQADFDFAWYNTITEINQLILEMELHGKIETDDVSVIT